MFKFVQALMFTAVFIAAPPVGRAVSAQTDEADRIREAVVVFDEVMRAPDNAIPGSVLGKAEGIAIFPGTLRGGFILGAQRGRGILSAKDPNTGEWSAPAFLTLTGGSIGAQIGGQSVDLILIIQNRRGLEYLLRNNFKIGAGASVAAGPVGRDATASTDIQLRAEILSYSRARGLFAGVSLEGSSVRADRDANRRFYGRAYNSRQVVFDARGGKPDPVPEWLETLKKYVG